MNPLEMFRDKARFIGLQVADEVPAEVVMAAILYLFHALLDEVFAEIPLTGRRGLQNGLNRLFLADGEEADLLGRTLRICRSFCQQILDFSKVFRDSNHVLLTMLRYTRQPMGPGYGKSDQSLFEGEIWPSTLLSCCRSQ